jgi:hypothetical protein
MRKASKYGKDLLNNALSTHTIIWNTTEVNKTTPRLGYYSKMKRKLCIKSGTTYTSYDATEIGRTSARFGPTQPSLIVTKMPSEFIPTDLYQYPESTLAKFDTVTTIPQGKPPNEPCKWRNDILQHLRIIDVTKLKQRLESTKIPTNVVSDGGVHHYQSNFGLVTAAKSDMVATNRGKIYSIEFHESSYCSELYGLLAAVVSLRHIIKSYKIIFPRQKEIFFYCDNKSVVNTINNCLELRRTVNQYCYPDADIELQLLHELHKLN